MDKNKTDYAKQTRKRLVIWFLIILFTVGLGLIWLIYGLQAAVLGFFCLLGTTIPIGLIVLLLFGLDQVVKEE